MGIALLPTIESKNKAGYPFAKCRSHKATNKDQRGLLTAGSVSSSLSSLKPSSKLASVLVSVADLHGRHQIQTRLTLDLTFSVGPASRYSYFSRLLSRDVAAAPRPPARPPVPHPHQSCTRCRTLGSLPQRGDPAASHARSRAQATRRICSVYGAGVTVCRRKWSRGAGTRHNGCCGTAAIWAAGYMSRGGRL